MDEHEHTRIDRWVRVVLVWGMVLSVSVCCSACSCTPSPTGMEEVDLSLAEIASGIARASRSRSSTWGSCCSSPPR